MVYNREGYAPWSLTRKAGVQSATVDGDIEVPQYIQPVLDTGFVDDKGDWKGVKSSEEVFHSFGLDEAIANGAAILAPQATGRNWPLDMTGYSDVMIAIKTNQAGSYPLAGVMGPSDFSFGNLTPVDAASNLRGSVLARDDFGDLLTTTATLTANVWNIFTLEGLFKGQKLLQFKITNSSGSEANIETAFMRLV